MNIVTKEGVAKVFINESDCTCTGDYSLHIVGKQLRHLGKMFRETGDEMYKQQGINLKQMAVRMFKRQQRLRAANL